MLSFEFCLGQDTQLTCRLLYWQLPALHFEIKSLSCFGSSTALEVFLSFNTIEQSRSSYCEKKKKNEKNRLIQ